VTIVVSSTNRRVTIMGYSATSAAFRTIEKIEATIKDRGFGVRATNGWLDEMGVEHFWERGDEQDDGAIVGEVMRVIPMGKNKGHCQGVGKLYIAPNGEIQRFPGLPREVLNIVRR
jgi:hypothetical protein